jgi:SAM-dependent methyltransferase
LSEVIWHDVECGGYTADLPLWEELVAKTSEGVMELGCGTGRVTRHIGKDTERLVMGIERDASLVTSLWERSQWRAGDAEIEDVRNFDLTVSRFDLVLAPMQLIQLLDGPDDRRSCLSCVAEHLSPDGLAAFAIVEEVPAEPAEGAAPPLPDVGQVEGWIYSSLPLASEADGDKIILRRLRQTVDPDGNMSDELNEIELCMLSAETLEREAQAVGLSPAGRREIPATEAHVGSTVVLLEKEA